MIKFTFQKIFFATFLLSLPCLVIGQVIQSHSFVGTIQLMDKSMITYKIEFNEMEDGTIKGKSISDFSGDHRTESELTGKIDRKEKTISFNEVSNLTTMSDSPSEDFCYVHLYNAKIKIKEKKSLIQGHFYSRYKDGEKCIEGDIYLMGNEYFFDKLKSLSNKKLVPKEAKEKLNKVLVDSRENLKNTVLEEDDELVIHASKNSIMIRVWEDEYLDGDRISIYQDGKPLLRNYAIKATQKQVLVPLLSESTEIRIVADTEGRIPPNSANILIINSGTNVPVKLRLNEGKEAIVRILKEN